MSEMTQGLAVIEPAGPQGMITLRGDLTSEAVAAAVEAGTGMAVPGQRQAIQGDEAGVLWMSPDELLILVPHDEAPARLEAMQDAAGEAFVTLADVSDAREMILLQGMGAREVLGKLMPVDFAQGAFQPGMVRRSRAAQVPAAVWTLGEDLFALISFRSVAGYVTGLLATAADPHGPVGFY